MLNRPFNYLILLILFVITMALSTVFGVIFFSEYGEIIGLVTGLILVSIMLIFIDRIFLYILEVSPMQARRAVHFHLENVQSLTRSRKVYTFVSKKYPCDIYCFENFRGSISIVIGKQVLEELTDLEIKAIFTLGLLKTKRGETRYLMLGNIFLNYLRFPVFFSRFFERFNVRPVRDLIRYIYFPIELFVQKYMHFQINEKDKEKLFEFKQHYDFESAEVKIKRISYSSKFDRPILIEGLCLSRF